MKIEDFLREMKSGDDIIISAKGFYNTEYILKLDCCVNEDTGEKHFCGEFYQHDDYDLSIDRDDDEPFYNCNTAADIIRKCKELSYKEDITTLDWEVYKTRDELIAENAELKAYIDELEKWASEKHE